MDPYWYGTRMDLILKRDYRKDHDTIVSVTDNGFKVKLKLLKLFLE